MTPYYERDGIVIYHGRMEEVVLALPPESVDLVLTDPPYGETSLPWDTVVPFWPALVYDLLSSAGSLWCFGSLRHFFEHLPEFDLYRFAQDVVWEKHNGTNFHNDRFRRVHEHVVHFYPRKNPWSEVYKNVPTTPDATRRTVKRSKQRPAHHGIIQNSVYTSEDGGPRLMRSVLQVRSCHGHAVHPTQKPEGIVTPLVLYSCPEGGLIFDPFMGSGTTLRVALNLGMRAIGCDADERWCEAAALRLQQLPLVLPAGGTGNTPGFGPGDSRFDS